jgi:hypothetical protein
MEYPLSKVPHYYGDLVRGFYIAGGIIMLLGLPFYADKTKIAFGVSLVAILVLVLLASLTNPRQKWVAILNVTFSAAAFLAFEYTAVSQGSLQDAFYSGFFWISQLLALDFFLATYYSGKTLRGIYFRGGGM